MEYHKAAVDSGVCIVSNTQATNHSSFAADTIVMTDNIGLGT